MRANRLAVAAGLALAAWACGGEGGRATLEGDAVRLTYDCASLRARARSDAERALVRAYAVNALRDARDHDRLSAADSIVAAYSGNGADDAARLERAVSRYVCAYGDVRAASARRFPERGSTPPDFALPLLADGGAAGDTVRLGELRGKVVILSFWATWCVPCRKELPELQDVAHRYRDQGVVLYTVLYQDRPSAAGPWLAELGVDVPVLLDRDEAVASAYRVRGVPHSYIIGRDGKVARSSLAYLPGLVERELRVVLGS